VFVLFVRYWDNSLTPAEAAELEDRLATDSGARELFHHFLLQAVTAADLSAEVPVDALAAEQETPVPDGTVQSVAVLAPSRSRLSRRRWFQLSAGGLAAGLGGAGLAWWLWPTSRETRARLMAARGTVTVRTPNGEALPVDGPLPERAVVATHGFGSSVIIAYADGSTVSLVGDSLVSARAGGLELHLERGAAAANVRRRAEDGPALSLATAQVLLPALSGALITLGQVARATDIEVHQGQVSAANPEGEALAVVRAGEMLTVQADGDLRKRRSSATPEQFTWDLSRPLPEGWEVGVRDVLPDGPVIRPESWPDPYYGGSRMYQIRSDQQWTRGFFRLVPDSLIRVRYRAKSSGRGQVCFCVRTDQSRCPDTGMLEYNDGFRSTAPGEWRWLDIRADKMLEPPNVEGPKFGAPWIGFLIIFNTYEVDLGLEIAEFVVARPHIDAG
jgi:hypothetical protein